MWKLGCQTKVNEDNMAIRTEQNVFRLQVSVDDTSDMQAFYTIDDLSCVESRSIPAQTTPSSKLSGKITSRVEVKNEIKVVRVVEGPP